MPEFRPSQRSVLINRKNLTVQTLFGVFILFLGMGVSPSRTGAQEPREPLSRAEVIRLLENGVAPERVGALAKQYGIDFQVTEGAEKQLRDAGATDELIGMCKALAPSETARPRKAPPEKKEAAKPAEPAEPKKFLLRDGTEVKLKFAQDLSSKTAMEGDIVDFVVAEDIWVGDTLVVRSGAPAVGEVSHVERGSLLGKSPELNVRINYMKIGSKRIRLRGTKGKEVNSNTGTLGILLSPLGLLRPGRQVEVKEGTHLTAYVDEDVNLPAAR